MKYDKILSIGVVAVFFGGLLFLSVKNVDTLKESAVEVIQDSKSLSDFYENAPQVEEDLKTSFSHKHEAADVYGAALNVLGNGIVGNYEFYKGPNGGTRSFSTGFDGSANVDSMLELNEVCKEIGIPLVYIKYPYRTSDEVESEFSGYSDFRKEVDRIYDAASDVGVNIYDFQDGGYFSDEELEGFYLNTDGHPKPHGEFLIAEYMCEQLNTDYGIEFPLYEQVFDESNYTVNSYPFMGNYSRNSGRFFSGVDTFDILHPKFETNMSLVIHDNDRKRYGTYDEVCLNGYEQKEDLDEYTYLITNYLQYPKASYSIYNYYADGPKLLVIGDSMLMSSMSYVALTSADVTIIDPRQGNNKHLVANALLGGDYDAVIVEGNSPAFFRAEFHSSVSLPEFEERTMEAQVAYCGVLVEYCNSQKQNNRTRITFDPNVKNFNLFGWAVDADAGTTFGSMYVCVGDNILQCDYGFDSTTPSDYYKNKNYKKSGFKITFDSSLLYDDNGELYDSLSIVCVSKDGKYKYEPVVLPLIPNN